MNSDSGLSPDASFRGLFGPNRRRQYLAGADLRPFRERARGFDARNAWWLAELSLLEYVPEQAFKRRRLARAGFADARFFGSSRSGGHCVVAHNDSTVLVVFRGTEVDSLRDLITDADVALAPEAGGGRVHRGFKRALDGVWRDVTRHLVSVRGARALWLTGHSLGAALATIAASRLGGDGPRDGDGVRDGGGEVDGLMTFGSPRVGDGDFARGIACPAWRVVNGNDVVARLPPFPYRHAGRLCYLDRGGRLHLEPPGALRWEDRWRGQLGHAQAVLRRWRLGDWRVVFNDDLYDHAPIHYARCLRRLAFSDAPSTMIHSTPSVARYDRSAP